MCGIAGFVAGDPAAPVDPALLQRMCDTIRHRGPDDSGVWTDAGVGLGHRRLAIIDLSPSGHQPMCNEDETVWIVFNGEIYNFQELRAGLVERGHVFRSRSDTVVIVHLYEELGDAFVERLDGMFAFAIWDTRQRRLLLARDRLGKKPLKYARVDGGLLFASELKALMASGMVSREVDPGQIDEFLSFGYVPAPGTGFRDVRKLEPGHLLVWKDGEVKQSRYWKLDYRRKEQHSEPEWHERIRESVTTAVRKRMISDVPLGAFLSGGIDSSIVVACMAEASDRPVETFSIGFEHEAYNELPYARQIAEKYGTSHHEFIVRADDVSVLPALARLYEEPFADSSALPSYFLARETRQHVTVALNGDGGDEGFVGYERYAQIERYRARLGWLDLPGVRQTAHSVARFDSLLPPGFVRRAEVAAGVVDADLGAGYGWLLRVFSEREKQRLYRPEMRALHAPAPARLLSRWADDPAAGTALADRVCFTDIMSFLPGDLLVKMDLATMIHSLEARSPFLDHRVLELAASIPADLRKPPGRLKWMLKQAFRDAFPPDFLDRPKSGFGIPVQEWFRGSLAGFCRDHLLASDPRSHAWFAPKAIERVVDQHVAGKISFGYQLWALLMLELWHREVVDGTGR